MNAKLIPFWPVLVVLLLVLASALTVGYVKSCFFPVGRYQLRNGDEGVNVTVIDTQTGRTKKYISAIDRKDAIKDAIVDFEKR